MIKFLQTLYNKHALKLSDEEILIRQFTPERSNYPINTDIDTFFKNATLYPIEIESYYMSAFDTTTGLIVRFWIENRPYAIANEGQFYPGNMVSTWISNNLLHHNKNRAPHAISKWSGCNPSPREMAKLCILYERYFNNNPKCHHIKNEFFYSLPYLKTPGGYFEIKQISREEFEEGYALNILKETYDNKTF